MSITKPNHPSRQTINGSWRLDPQRSSIRFRAGHFWGLMTVSGHFDDYDGHLDLSANPAVELTIDADTVQTGNRKRDQHLRSADFFDIENHPRVRFLSDSVDLHGDALKVRAVCPLAAVQSRLSSRRTSAGSTASSRSKRPLPPHTASWG